MAGFNAPRHVGVAGLLALTVLCAGSGCRRDETDKPPRQFFPDLDDQPKYKPQARSTFFKEYVEKDAHGLEDWRTGSSYGRTMREPVEGSVPFGYTSHASASGDVRYMGVDFAERTDLLGDDDVIYRGVVGVQLGANGAPLVDEAGQPLPKYAEYIPIPVDAELLKLGEQKYNIFCIVCHGGTGAGDGTVGSRWAYPLPTYHDPKYAHGGEKGQDGYIFHVIRNGVPNPGGTYPLKMPSYATKLSEHESWAVVAYIRALQKTHTAGMGAVPEAERQRLERQRGGTGVAPAAPPQGANQPSLTNDVASANRSVTTQPMTEGTP